MNNIITLDQLVNELARRANITTDEARSAILTLQQEIIDSLISSSGNADVPYIGRFSVSDPGKGTIEFTADNQMAETVNEPFAFFEPVQLYADSIDTVDTPNTEQANESAITTEVEEPAADIIDQTTIEEPVVVVEETTEVATEDIEPEVVEEPQAAPIPVRYHYTVPLDDESTTEQPEETITEEQAAVTEQTTEAATREEQPATPVDGQLPYDNDEPAVQSDDAPHSGMSPLIAYILGILTGMILMCVAVYFLYPPLNFSDDVEYVFDDELTTTDDEAAPSLSDDTNAAIESPAETQSEPTPATPVATTTKPTPSETSTGNKTNNSGVITDTVSSTNYLAIMARKYYGNTEFWVYIYKENEAILGHPDRVPAGTVVVIPPASKYGIDANDPESIRRAKKLNGPIYAPYRK